MKKHGDENLPLGVGGFLIEPHDVGGFCIKPNLSAENQVHLGGGGVAGSKNQITQKGLKLILILKFLKPDETFEIMKILYVATSKQHPKQPLHRHGHHSDQFLSRCAFETPQLKNK